MRLSNVAILAGAFAGAAIISLGGARIAVATVESVSETGVRGALDKAGLEWAEVESNGLQVALTGTAPSEATRFRARTVAATVVEASRVIDEMEVEASDDIAPPQFSIELLRNDEELSLAGLIPAETDRDALIARFEAVRGVDEVSDLLQTADYPTPDGWDRTVNYAIRVLREVPRSKISLDAGQVSIRAMSGSVEEKRELERVLRNAAPERVALALDISAPRPVIAPFTLRFLIDDQGARFDACSADTEEARNEILAAAEAAGMTRTARCVLGLGSPSPDWSEAAALSIRSLGELGSGSVTLSDADIALVVAPGTDQGTYDRVVGELENALPDVFTLHSVRPSGEEEEQGPPEFIASLSPEGELQIRGRINDEVTRRAAESFAKARFGSDSVHLAARLDEDLPEGWPLRILATLEALAQLDNGTVTATPDSISIRGNTGNDEASAEIARLLSDKLGEGEDFTIDVAYQEALDPTLNLPTPDQCIEELAQIQQVQKINFEPGSATVDAASRGVLDDIADVLKACQPIELSLIVGGHTDSQGREEMNQQLSQERAQAVLAELRNRRVLTANFDAIGYGEAQPIADNGTEEGREENRRIEFTLAQAAEIVGEGDSDDEPLENATDSGAEEDAAADEGGDAAEDTAPDEQN